ncbi:tRNA (adenosine(37)-N6)-threonylcarbamoyltransferase complex ATPase subunit type 1 TsaE [Candidatus Babeliales bacterium]|nr:tRNA (adenosine(37)-N6)-threonylcarbamoyltransferase complex ATPase subunit type 1 TsaE [Candidatus Babeliales bacterium]
MWNAIYEEKDLKDIVSEHFMPLFQASSIFAFIGPLGAGKTTFVRECLRQIGIAGLIQSPTFTYLSEYGGKNHIEVCHFDLYRIGSEEEFCSMGFDEVLQRTDSVFFIEWPEVVSNLLSKLSIHKKVYKIMIDYNEKKMRSRQVLCDL